MLTAKQFQYTPDMETAEELRKIPLVSTIANFLQEQKTTIGLQTSIEALPRESAGTVEKLVRESTSKLGVEVPLRVGTITDPHLNAFVFGSNKNPTLVITSGLLEQLDQNELRAVIAHEMGHIKCDHIELHSVGNLLASGASSVLGSISPLSGYAMKLLFYERLCAWFRDSEVSADRASLLVAQDLGLVERVHGILALQSTKRYLSMTQDQIHQHLRELESQAESGLLDLWRTHPPSLTRLQKLREYAGSLTYAKALRLLYSNGIIRCRFCGDQMDYDKIFCSRCSRSQF